MSITKARARANFTMKIGDKNYGLGLPLSGYAESSHDSLLIGWMGALASVSEALPTTATVTKFTNPDPIPPNTRGQKPRTFKFLITEGGVATGDEALTYPFSIRVPEYNATPEQEEAFITQCLGFAKYFNDDDICQLIGIY